MAIKRKVSSYAQLKRRAEESESYEEENPLSELGEEDLKAYLCEKGVHLCKYFTLVMENCGGYDEELIPDEYAYGWRFRVGYCVFCNQVVSVTEVVPILENALIRDSLTEVPKSEWDDFEEAIEIPLEEYHLVPDNERVKEALRFYLKSNEKTSLRDTFLDLHFNRYGVPKTKEQVSKLLSLMTEEDDNLQDAQA